MQAGRYQPLLRTQVIQSKNRLIHYLRKVLLDTLRFICYSLIKDGAIEKGGMDVFAQTQEHC